MKWFLTICLCGWWLSLLARTYEEGAVAAVLMGEARSDGVPGMTAVGEVIHQRTMEKGQTPLQIVAACRGHVHSFSCLNGTTLDRLIQKYRRQPSFQQALQISRAVCEAPHRLPGLAKGATHFTRASKSPFWANGEQPVATIGRHAFYRLKHY
jgi:spore germination cell wall hydrolase CwlJ-like protein